ncbi:nuclear transport factor 2 family protein [Aquimarina sp. AD1]|uniref:nuclear transport factor 2 family protein n=1 Tax=Aquimarina sp. (strain AD1) TaxID=1714848 RepID=UPI000E49B561|nr:nuclear transport factor 2 family protein [Aquimarina sp. AD1]AXT55761.1 nuclear transport factor 2 family protein [Aquimarina sp. AD1]RKN09926.1 nuclear transport factor 2 family protein [Aquimarina sp. AD1]
MCRFLIICLLLISGNVAFSQKELNTNHKNAKQAVLDFFEGFHKGDTSMIRKTISPSIAMQTIARTKEGKTKAINTDMSKFLEVIHNRPKDQKWLEKLLDFRIDADAHIAQIWTPYEFYVNDQFSHCGVNIFQLFNDGDTWKIIAIADTRKKEGCK